MQVLSWMLLTRYVGAVCVDQVVILPLEMGSARGVPLSMTRAEILAHEISWTVGIIALVYLLWRVCLPAVSTTAGTVAAGNSRFS